MIEIPASLRLLLLRLRVMVPFWVVLGGYFTVVSTILELSFGNGVVLIGAFEKVLVDSLIFLILISILSAVKLLRRVRMPAVFLFFSAFFIDCGVMFYGGTRLEHYHLGLILSESAASWFTPISLSLFAGLCLAVYFEWRVLRSFTPPPAYVVVATALAFPFLLLLDLPERYNSHRIAGLTADPEGNDQEISDLSYLGSLVQYLRPNSFLHLAGVLFYSPEQSPTVQTPAQIENGPLAISTYQLPIGPRHYQQLGLEPFRRVIMVTADSLSLDLLAPYNPLLPADLYRFYNHPEVVNRMFTELHSSEVASMNGLQVIFNSHPNAAILSGSNDNPLSMVNKLRSAGFRTVHMRGTSTLADSENELLRRLGFGEIVAAEEFKQYLPRRYFTGLGLMDRILFQAAVERLKLAGDQPIFLHLAATDTRPLDGRLDYDGLEYPRLPVVLPVPKLSQPLLTSVIRHSFDIGLFVELLRRERLLDEHTLLIVTADHCFPLNSVVRQIPGYQNSPLCRIPFLVLTAQQLPPSVALDSPASQIDIAPTIFHLLGLAVPDGWWGDSMYFPEKKNPVIGTFRNTIDLSLPGDEIRIGLDLGHSAAEDGLLELYWSIVPTAGSSTAGAPAAKAAGADLSR